MRYIFFLLLIYTSVSSQIKTLQGNITYIANDIIYISLGSSSGLRDSAIVNVISKKDTSAILKVFATSSKSAACHIYKKRKEFNTGDRVVSFLLIPEKKNISGADTIADTEPASKFKEFVKLGENSESTLDIDGRISLQYFTLFYPESMNNLSQPGVTLNLRSSKKNFPLKVDFYGNFRSLSVGKSIFPNNASNQLRIYKASLDYEDENNMAGLGRIIPYSIPSFGYLDGITYSRKEGEFLFGTALGYQPERGQEGVNTEYKKYALFLSYVPRLYVNSTLTLSYSRTYFHSDLDREAVSMNLLFNRSSSFYVYGYSDFDLRKKSNHDFVLSPELTGLYINANYIVTEYLSFGLGINSFRPFNNYSFIKNIPDSLIDRKLRNGTSLNMNIALSNRITLYNTLSVRFNIGRENDDYTNYSWLNWNDIFSTGTNFRMNISLNSNQYTKSKGYGVSLQRNLFNILDISFRFQGYSYNTIIYNNNNHSETFGVDLVVLFSRSYSLIFMFERLKGYSSNSNSLFSEISWRF